MIAPRSTSAVTLALLLFLAACSSARAVPRGCDRAGYSAPSVSVAHLADSSAGVTPRLLVTVTTPFPAHLPLVSAQVSIYSDTLPARATRPLRTGVTDSNGRAELGAVGTGRYGLRAHAEGADEFFTVVSLRGGSSDSLEVRVVRREQLCY